MSETKRLETAEEVKAHAADMELAGIDFLDKRGRRGARWEAAASVRPTFIDGAVAELPRAEFDKLQAVEFNLHHSTLAGRRAPARRLRRAAL